MAETGWTDELKAQVIEMYQMAEPTPETSTQIVADIAEELDKTVNGVRMILQRADVYVKKSDSAKSTKTDDKPKKKSKADLISELKAAIESAGVEVEDKVVDKMTGIAAEYFTKVINAAKGD